MVSIIMRGLSNLGNTCYLNAILQILFNTRSFPELFEKYAARISPTERSTHPLYIVATAFQSLMYKYHDTVNDSAVRAELVRFVKIFNHCHTQFGYGQQDGHEYLTFLMRAIHDSMYLERRIVIRSKASNYGDLMEQKAIEAHRVHGSSTTELMLGSDDTKTCYDSVVFELFTGQYRFQTQCRQTGCEYVSDRFETFRCCEVPLGNPQHKQVKLDDILTEYTSVTELDEAYECDKCHIRSKCYRICTLWRCPQILVVNLKRGIHHYDRKRNTYVELKDDRDVEIPEMLDMSKYCSVDRKRTRYTLYATGNHFGDTNDGHYYAQIKDQTTGKWYVVNDQHVKEGMGPSNHICLLFYQLDD